MENSLATIGGFCCGTSFVVDHQVCLLLSPSNCDLKNKQEIRVVSIFPKTMIINIFWAKCEASQGF